MERLNQSFFFYVGKLLLIKFIFFLFNNLFFFLTLGFLYHDINRIFFLIIYLKFFFGIKKIIPNKFSYIRYKRQFGNLKKSYNNGDDNNNNSKKHTYHLGSRFSKCVESCQCKRNSHGDDKHLHNRDSQRSNAKCHTSKQSSLDIFWIYDFHSNKRWTSKRE